ncbi:hypothetical protein NCC49_004059 [Naganishia albida]|nr:hypothetical protein NCC49_004059 [Naganishia albida]
MPALIIDRRQEPVIESSSPPSPKPEATIEDPEGPPAPKEPTTRKTSSAEPTETGGGLAGLFGFGNEETSSFPPTRTRTSAIPTPTIEEDDNGFFGFGGDDESTSSSRTTPRPTPTRTASREEPTETGPGLLDGMDNIIKSCGGSQDSSLLSDECQDVAQENLIGAIILAIGALILFGFLILILKWFYVKFKSRRAPRATASASSEKV